MTGLERLRELACDMYMAPIWATVRADTERKYETSRGDRKTINDLLRAIADQIERELREKLCESQIYKLRAMAVYLEMNTHVLGHEGMADSPVARWARELRAALGGDGRDPAADVSVSAYDPPSQEDRDAIAWVRDHGGLDAVKRRWECLSYYADPVPRSCMEKRLARLQRQIDESHAALRRRREIISELNRRATDLTRENAGRRGTIRELSDRAAQQSDEIRVMRDVIAETCARLGVKGTGSTVDDAQVIWREISRRLMPDGMCWPVFEDGEPVRIGDFVSDVEVRSVVFRDGGILLSDCTSVPGWGTWRSYKEPIKRPAPKVLDADGAEIRVGDTVYQMGCKYRVSHLHGANGKVRIVYENSGRWVDPKTLTHRAPVLASDGRPLREGETVWDENGDELVIGALEDGGHTVTCRYVDVGDAIPVHGMWSPSDLTHERPDSWERIEEDAKKDRCSYFGAKYRDCGRCTQLATSCSISKARDIVRRAKKLADRGQ